MSRLVAFALLLLLVGVSTVPTAVAPCSVTDPFSHECQEMLRHRQEWARETLEQILGPPEIDQPPLLA